jgi:hypothetical protein
MSEPKTAEPLVLSVNAIINGQFFSAGTPLPFTDESALPESLKPFVAGPDAPKPFDPSVRNIYDLSPLARREVRRLESIAAEKEWAQQVADEPLPPETAAALEASHELHIGRAKAQAEYSQRLSDGIYKQLEEEAAARVVQLYVRRGGEWGRVQNSKLKPGETVFAKRENGEMEAVGVINSRGEPPPQEIIP